MLLYLLINLVTFLTKKEYENRLSTRDRESVLKYTIENKSNGGHILSLFFALFGFSVSFILIQLSFHHSPFFEKPLENDYWIGLACGGIIAAIGFIILYIGKNQKITATNVTTINILIFVVLILASISSAFSTFEVFKDKEYNHIFEHDSNLFIFLNFLSLDLTLSYIHWRHVQKYRKNCYDAVNYGLDELLQR